MHMGIFDNYPGRATRSTAGLLRWDLERLPRHPCFMVLAVFGRLNRSIAFASFSLQVHIGSQSFKPEGPHPTSLEVLGGGHFDRRCSTDGSLSNYPGKKAGARRTYEVTLPRAPRRLNPRPNLRPPKRPQATHFLGCPPERAPEQPRDRLCSGA